MKLFPFCIIIVWVPSLCSINGSVPIVSALIVFPYCKCKLFVRYIAITYSLSPSRAVSFGLTTVSSFPTSSSLTIPVPFSVVISFIWWLKVWLELRFLLHMLLSFLELRFLRFMLLWQFIELTFKWLELIIWQPSSISDYDGRTFSANWFVLACL